MVEVSLCGAVAGICFTLELLNYNFFELKTLTSFIISTPKKLRNPCRANLHYGKIFRKLQEKFFSVM